MRQDHAGHLSLRDQVWYQRLGKGTQAIFRRATPEWLRSLSRRLITALIAIPVVVALVWYGGWVAFAGGVLLLGLGIYELHSMFHKLGYNPLTGLSFLFGVALFVGAIWSPTWRQTVMEAVISALVLGSLSWLLITRHEPGKALMDWALTLVMTLYLAWPFSYLLTLRGGTPGDHTPRFWWLMVVLFGVWAFDSAAFFAGRFFGKHYLAPVISPGKTWEGAIGGTLFTTAAVFVFSRPIQPAVAWYHVLALSVLISFAATIGDLAESLIKRQAGVKDSGNFFWGHGGVLDRIDSLLFASVVVYFYATMVLHVV
jgi:phosphatidate cytidylyltransferase